MFIQRTRLFVQRLIRARALGVPFLGTTRFILPTTFRLGRRTLTLAAPAEAGLKSDFIDLVLDDDYGLRHLPAGLKTVLDVGANCGLFSLLASHYFRSATIHAYEPNPRIFPYTAANLAQVGVTCFQSGVGSRAGFASMADEGESRLAQTRPAEGGQIRIVALAEAVANLGAEIDLLKLDCEGAEWDIFQDANIFRKIHRIHMEYHLDERHHLDTLRAMARSLGFRIDHLSPNHGFGMAWLSRLN